MDIGINSNISNDIIYSQKLIVPAKVASLIPSALAKQYNLFPVKKDDQNLYVAMEDVDDFIAIDHIKRITGLNIIPNLLSKGIIRYHINQLYGNEPIERALEDFHREMKILEQENNSYIHSAESIGSAPIVRIVDYLIDQAIIKKASDIHIEPMENSTRVRFRIDGLLQQIAVFPRETHDQIITRIKILGNMNIAEKRLPQDGRSEIKALDRNIDIRISTAPTIHGEKCVLRLLDHNYFLFPKEDLGFSEDNLRHFNRFLDLSWGIILITGPVGSGKSTTLYTMLNEINDETDNIITIEDPVECKIPGINQIQINTKANMTFANALRSVLRLDPDVIMVGEIRDVETAKMAIRASITGHLVLSTVHTYNAIGAIRRLIDMEVENYLLSETLMGIISQRLVRRLCLNCCEVYTPSHAQLEMVGLPLNEDIRWFKSVGCIKCNYSGFKGRIAIHEILSIDNVIRQLIQENASSGEIYRYAIQKGFEPLNRASVNLLSKGLTTLEEIIHIINSVE